MGKLWEMEYGSEFYWETLGKQYLSVFSKETLEK